LVFFLLLLATNLFAQVNTIATNLADLAQQAFSGDNCLYLPFYPWLCQAYSNDGAVPWWVDCSQLSCAELFQGPTNVTMGVPAYNVVLTKNILTGETTVRPDDATDIIARIEPPSGYQPGQLSSQDVWVWRLWQQWTNCPDCWGIDGEMPPPIVTLKVLLADINDYATYQSNLDAEAEAQSSSESSFTMGGMFSAMADDGMLADDSGPCTITNEAASYQVVSTTLDTNGFQLVFESCSDHAYLVASTDVLATDTVWGYLAAIAPGQDGTTSWTDASTTNADISARFYKVDRWWLGDTVGDGIPDWWRQFYFGTGTTTNELSCALCNPQGDGYSNLEKYLQGANPNVYESSPYGSGSVTTVRYHYDQDGRMTSAFFSATGAETLSPTPGHNLQQDNSLTK
jgi:hypothetical protein